MGDPSSRVRKRKSPFRIKTGCVVAWRMNDVNNGKISIRSNQRPVQFGDYDIVWTQPRPSDQLVGKRIRCFVQKQITEGEVIRVSSKKNAEQQLSIELLVDNTERNRTLQPIVQEDSGSLEASIRGLDKITLSTTLNVHNPSWVVQRLVPKRLFEHTTASSSNHSNSSNGENKPNKASENGEVDVVKKQRRKRKPVIRYAGDKLDKEEQQVKNWRWLCSRYHELAQEPDVVCQLAAGWIGRVVSMDMSFPNTLALLTIERLFVFDNLYYGDAQNIQIQIPVEHVVILAKSIENPTMMYSRFYNLFASENLDFMEAIENHEYCEHCRKHSSLFKTPLTQPNRYCIECQATDNHERFCRQLEQKPENPTWIEFGLPRDLLEKKPIPSLKPITKDAPKPKKVVQRRSPKRVPKPKPPTPEPIVVEDYSVFKPTCARTMTYDRKRKRRMPIDDSPKLEQRRNVREERIKHDRASRANQRWLNQHIKYNYLVNRENQIRFDRSKIHAWGVFADVFISADEMIVEYRGELIGNAVAEQREKEYEAAKIGSDYMFRIDKESVCDATRIGCIARFLNASCDPNCYTKIITVDGTKRIGIYAKKDIEAGDELCYDYKFPLEYDESKRIPCHCGAKDCRGFMNWDKRYRDMPKPLETNSIGKQPSQVATDETKKKAANDIIATKPPAASESP